MKNIILAALLILAGSPIIALADNINTTEQKIQGKQLFDSYLQVYNERLNNPDGSEKFLEDLAGKLHQPFLIAPQVSAPRSPATDDEFSNSFESFITFLNKKGATKLHWKEINLYPLNEKKTLANNVAYATDKDGKIVYETISVYLLYKSDAGWKIAMFSPYDIANKLEIK